MTSNLPKGELTATGLRMGESQCVRKVICGEWSLHFGNFGSHSEHHPEANLLHRWQPDPSSPAAQG